MKDRGKSVTAMIILLWRKESAVVDRAVVLVDKDTDLRRPRAKDIRGAESYSWLIMYCRVHAVISIERIAPGA